MLLSAEIVCYMVLVSCPTVQAISNKGMGITMHCMAGAYITSVRMTSLPNDKTIDHIWKIYSWVWIVFVGVIVAFHAIKVLCALSPLALFLKCKGRKLIAVSICQSNMIPTGEYV